MRKMQQDFHILSMKKKNVKRKEGEKNPKNEKIDRKWVKKEIKKKKKHRCV